LKKIQPEHWKLPEILLARGRLAEKSGDRAVAIAEYREAARVAALRFGARDPRTLAAERAVSEAAGSGAASD
jgi:hypothetical protein